VGDSLSASLSRFVEFLSDYVPLAQGAYYLLTGLWPWFHLSSFLWVTGPKTDLWLVQTVGALVAVLGATLCVGAVRREKTWSMITLALGSAAALAFVDVLFVAQQRIPPIYLLDGAVEVGLVALWVHAWWAGHHPLGTQPWCPPGTTSSPQAIPMTPPR